MSEDGHQHPDLLQTLTRLQGQVLDLAGHITNLVERVARLEAGLEGIEAQLEEDPKPDPLETLS